MSTRPKEFFLLVGRLLLAGTFVWAAIPKLLDPGSFAETIQNYRLLPEGWAGAIALVVPSFELVVALALLLPTYRRGAALSSLVMLLLFSAAMTQARVRGIDLSCGCFGAAFEAKVSWLTVARSLLLACVAGFVWWASGSGPGVPPEQQARASEALPS